MKSIRSVAITLSALILPVLAAMGGNPAKSEINTVTGSSMIEDTGASPIAVTGSSDRATDKEIVSFFASPAAFTTWLEQHDAATHPDALARTINAVEQLQLNDASKMQIVSDSVARLIRTCGSSAHDVLVTVSKQVSARWVPVIVTAAILARSPDGRAAQPSLIASCAGKDGIEAKARARASANSPGRLLGIANAVRTATPPVFARSVPMPLPSRSTTGPVAPPVIAAIESNEDL